LGGITTGTWLLLPIFPTGKRAEVLAFIQKFTESRFGFLSKTCISGRYLFQEWQWNLYVCLIRIIINIFLVCLGYYNKIPYNEWLLNNRCLFIIVPEAGSSRSSHWQIWCLMRTWLLVHRTVTPCYDFTW
jgi:hypothetical protein